MRAGPHLITYPDSLGGSLAVLDEVLRTRLAGLFSGVHILPPFPSSGDRGFAPITYETIEPAFGAWADVRRLGDAQDVALDLIVNHVSRRSPAFRDFEEHGRESAAADLFLTLDKVWPDGDPRPEDLARIHLRRPRPWSTYRIAATGAEERVWTTFGPDDPSEQIDLDSASPAARAFVAEQLARFAAHGVRLVRLDAVGYVVKRAGTSCFMVEPEIDEFLAWARSVADGIGIELLTEVHAARPLQHRLATTGCWVYDFVLPGLVLETFRTGNAAALIEHLRTSPPRQVTTLDSHDGIPIQPDLDGVVPPDAARELVAHAVERGANVSRLFTTAHLPDPTFDAHQVNCTYRSAMGDDEAYVAARAIQLFAPGIPQVYYVGLLGGLNDHAAVQATGEGRAINRHDYPLEEIDAALADPLVGRLVRLVRLRHDHPAFAGSLEVHSNGSGLVLAWENGGDRAELTVDLTTPSATISTTQRGHALETWDA